jgi:flavodoxin
MQRILVVYYSISGHTRDAAIAIGAGLGADIEPIVEPATTRITPWSYFTLGMKGVFGMAAPIGPGTYDPTTYDLVILGTPIWGGKMSAPARSYVMAHRGQFRRLALFCTQGGTGGETALAEMATIAETKAAAMLALSDADRASGKSAEKIAGFVAALRGASVP